MKMIFENQGDLRRKYGGMEDDEDLVSFFNEVLERREEIDARGLDDQDLEVDLADTSDEASLGNLPEHASLGT